MIKKPLHEFQAKYTADSVNLIQELSLLGKLKEKGPWLAGGSLLRLVNNEPISRGDLDFYFPHSYSSREFVNKLANETIRSRRAYNNTTKSGLNIQLITEYYGSIEEVFKEFDFSICQFATDGYYIYASEQTWNDAENRTLRPVKEDEEFWYYSDLRLSKYFFRGYIPYTEKLIQHWFYNHWHQIVYSEKYTEEDLRIEKIPYRKSVKVNLEMPRIPMGDFLFQ